MIYRQKLKIVYVINKANVHLFEVSFLEYG